MKAVFCGLCITLCFALLLSCSTTDKSSSSADGVASPISDKEYENLAEKYTKAKKLYDGFDLAFEFHATLLTSDLQEAQVWIESSDFQWTREKTQMEREKVAANSSKETQVFLSFFSPDNETDNLETTGSVWKIFLVAGGMKYEGKAVRTGGIMANLQRKYPQHTRFNTPYLVTFKTPVNLVQQNDTKFILTGTVGTGEVEFPSTATQ
jgi:hypothetical protein